MNDELTHFDNIADDKLKEIANMRKSLRAERRAAAINIVNMAREHAGRREEPYSQSDADVIMLLVELLDKVAGG